MGNLYKKVVIINIWVTVLKINVHNNCFFLVWSKRVSLNMIYRITHGAIDALEVNT